MRAPPGMELSGWRCPWCDAWNESTATHCPALHTKQMPLSRDERTKIQENLTIRTGSTAADLVRYEMTVRGLEQRVKELGDHGDELQDRLELMGELVDELNEAALEDYGE